MITASILASMSVWGVPENLNLFAPPPPCQEIAKTRTIDFKIRMEYETNASECSGIVACWASCYTLFTLTAIQQCCVADVPATPGIVYEADSDGKGSGDPGCVTSAEAEGNALQYGVAEAAWYCNQGTSEVRAQSIIKDIHYKDSLGNPCWTSQLLGLASAGIAASKEFVYSGTAEWATRLSIETQIDTVGEAEIGSTRRQTAQFVSHTLRRGSNAVTVQGVVAAVTEGTGAPQIVRLGLFQGTAFDALASGNATIEDIVISSAVPAGEGSVILEVVHDAVTDLDGNMNPDEDGEAPMVCYVDRAILKSLLGTSIGQSSYIVRADLNLDGVIDASDMAVFNSKPCSANWDCSTGSPALTANDFAAFANSYASADPVADVDGSGYLTANDFQAFLNAYAIGCN